MALWLGLSPNRPGPAMEPAPAGWAVTYNRANREPHGVMVSQPLKATLPSTEELPCSDDTPVDNEDQNLLPNLLLFALTLLCFSPAIGILGFARFIAIL